MNAALALRTARTAGVGVALDDEDLVLMAAAPPAATLLDLLSAHKAGIVALLRPGPDGWSAADWHAFFEERAAIAEFDGSAPRAAAEARAVACCVAEWLERNPARSFPGRCLACGTGDRPHDPVLAFGTGATGHAWLHGGCWKGWHDARVGAAVAALAAMGIEDGRCR